MTSFGVASLLVASHLSVKTYEARGAGMERTFDKPSSIVATEITGRMGPKISSFITSIDMSADVKIVGGKKRSKAGVTEGVAFIAPLARASER